MRPDLIRTLRASTSSALPALRVIGLVYTGLGGIVAMGLVISVALFPSTPILQQVAEPARQAVTTFIQPTTELVTGISGPSAAPITVRATAPKPTRFIDATTLSITIGEPVISEEAPVAEPTPRPPVPRTPPLIVQDLLPPADEQPLEEDVQPTDEVNVVAAPVAEPEIVQPAEPTMQVATSDQPQTLPTPAPLTEKELKAQVEAQNHAVIEANKAAAVQAKADASAANHAAIEANKAAMADANAPAMADSNLTLPTASGSSSRSAADVANRIAIDSARAAAAQAKADANAANAAAISAAKAAKAAATKH